MYADIAKNSKRKSLEMIAMIMSIFFISIAFIISITVADVTVNN